MIELQWTTFTAIHTDHSNIVHIRRSVSSIPSLLFLSVSTVVVTNQYDWINVSTCNVLLVFSLPHFFLYYGRTFKYWKVGFHLQKEGLCLIIAFGNTCSFVAYFALNSLIWYKFLCFCHISYFILVSLLCFTSFLIVTYCHFCTCANFSDTQYPYLEQIS